MSKIRLTVIAVCVIAVGLIAGSAVLDPPAALSLAPVAPSTAQTAPAAPSAAPSAPSAPVAPVAAPKPPYQVASQPVPAVSSTVPPQTGVVTSQTSSAASPTTTATSPDGSPVPPPSVVITTSDCVANWTTMEVSPSTGILTSVAGRYEGTCIQAAAIAAAYPDAVLTTVTSNATTAAP